MLVVSLRAQVVIDECLPDTFEEALDEALPIGGWIQLACPLTNTLTTTKRISTDTILENTAATGWLVMGSSNRFFEIDPGVRLTLINVRMSSGQAIGVAGTSGASGADGTPGGAGFGGAVFNNGGFLFGSNVTFFNCKALGGPGGRGLDTALFGGPPTDGGPGGSAGGGAVYNEGGEVRLTNSLFQSNTASGGAGGEGGSSSGTARDGADGGSGSPGAGGAIFNLGGQVWLYGCTNEQNTAKGAAGGVAGLGGGLIYFDGRNGSSAHGWGGGLAQAGGQSHLERCTISRNLAQGADGLSGNLHAPDTEEAAGQSGLPGLGGGIAVESGSLLLKECSVSRNTANGGNGGDGGQAGGSGNGGDGGTGGYGQGGGVYLADEAMADCLDSSFSRNFAFGGYGGLGELGRSGLAMMGVDGPAGPGQGGGIYAAGVPLTLSRCTLDRNGTQGGEGREGAPGSAFEPGVVGNPGGAGQGGGLFAFNTRLGVTNSTFYANNCVGGKGGDGGAGGNGLLFATDGGDGGSGGPALGGGAWCDSAEPSYFISCTFSTNVVTGGTNGLGGAAGDPNLADPGNPGSRGLAAGASIAGTGAGIFLRNTLLAYPGGGANSSGLITDNGYNTSSTDTPPFELTSSSNNVNPQLLNLADNGGPTQTCALRTNSPAINTADPLGSPPTDQRGLVRGPLPDRGSYEADAVAQAPSLAIAAGQPLIVSWPDWAIGYRLESTPSLRTPSWTRMGPEEHLGGHWAVPVNPTNATQYFRLRQ